MLLHKTELIGSFLFLLAILHTFSVKLFQNMAKKYKEGSIGENLFHLLGEVEIIFGLWSFVFFIFIMINESLVQAQNYIESRNFTEPLFVFAVMVVASTKPIIDFASQLITTIAKLIPGIKPIFAFYGTCLILGPLLGSFITEPAAMTVTAMILLETLFKQKLSIPLKYATLGLLFVNVSIGGTLTHFAAPPVIMVAQTWGWDSFYLLSHFGWKAALSILLATLFVIIRFYKELQLTPPLKLNQSKSPLMMSLIHLLFLGLIVATSHHPKLFISILLFFLGFATVTKEYQAPIKIREGLLVGFFLGGLVTLGGVQTWWINSIVSQLQSWSLFLSATGLTAIVDNAALTYLGSLVPDLSETSKYALVAGAVVGGGLTVIANAPNPIGYGILSSRFGKEGINPILLFKEALIPTLIAGICFWFL